MNIITTKEGWKVIEEDSHVGKWIIESGRLDHDQHLIPIATSNIPEGGIAIDCGALYGDHTIQYSRKVGPEGCVLAIEANPLAYSCLCENAKRFQGPTICMNLALGEVHGGTAVHIMDSCNVGASTVSNGNGEVKTDKIEKEIRTATIDGIVHDSNLERCDFIKLDIEGFEYQALKGAERTLKHFKPKLLIEINAWTLSQQGTSAKEIYDYLLSLNYSWRIVQSDCTGSSPQYDIACWANIIETPKLIKAQRIK